MFIPYYGLSRIRQRKRTPMINASIVFNIDDKPYTYDDVKLHILPSIGDRIEFTSMLRDEVDQLRVSEICHLIQKNTSIEDQTINQKIEIRCNKII